MKNNAITTERKKEWQNENEYEKIKFIKIPNITLYYLINKKININKIEIEDVNIPNTLLYYLLGNYTINDYLEKNFIFSKSINIDTFKIFIGCWLINQCENLKVSDPNKNNV